jgi:hypothetical protein
MADATENVPLSVLGTLEYPGAAAYISTYGQPLYQQWFSGPTSQANWFIVVDLTTLKGIVELATQDYQDLPSEVAEYVGQGDKLLIYTTLALSLRNVPQGNLFNALKTIGAGPLLDRAEQISVQIGTGTLDAFSYILVATMDEGGVPGFEEFSYSYAAVETLQLMPVTIDGKTTYSPVTLD